MYYLPRCSWGLFKSYYYHDYYYLPFEKPVKYNEKCFYFDLYIFLKKKSTYQQKKTNVLQEK